MSDNYVMIWREPSSMRLRTYTSPTTGRPLAGPLSSFVGDPERFVHSPAELESVLQESEFGPVAVSTVVASAALGWDATDEVRK